MAMANNVMWCDAMWFDVTWRDVTCHDAMRCYEIAIFAQSLQRGQLAIMGPLSWHLIQIVANRLRSRCDFNSRFRLFPVEGALDAQYQDGRTIEAQVTNGGPFVAGHPLVTVEEVARHGSTLMFLLLWLLFTDYRLIYLKESILSRRFWAANKTKLCRFFFKTNYTNR